MIKSRAMDSFEDDDEELLAASEIDLPANFGEHATEIESRTQMEAVCPSKTEGMQYV